MLQFLRSHLAAARTSYHLNRNQTIFVCTVGRCNGKILRSPFHRFLEIPTWYSRRRDSVSRCSAIEAAGRRYRSSGVRERSPSTAERSRPSLPTSKQPFHLSGYPAHRPSGTGGRQKGPLPVRDDRTDRRVSTSVDRSTSVNGIVLYIVGILWRPPGRRRRLRAVLLRRVGRATPERRDAMGASPIRRLRRVHVGGHAGHAAAAAAAASAARSCPRRTLAAVQGRA